MNIPELKKIKSEKKYHNTTLKDDYSWVDQPDILDVLKSIKDDKTLIIFATHNRSLVNKSDLELTISNGNVTLN